MTFVTNMTLLTLSWAVVKSGEAALVPRLQEGGYWEQGWVSTRWGNVLAGSREPDDAGGLV